MARTRWPSDPVNPGLLPRPGRSDRQRRRVPENLGPGRQIVSQDSPDGVSRIGGQAGTQAPDPTPVPVKTGEAGPEALSTVSLPNISVSAGCRGVRRWGADHLLRAGFYFAGVGSG